VPEDVKIYIKGVAIVLMATLVLLSWLVKKAD